MRPINKQAEKVLMVLTKDLNEPGDATTIDNAPGTFMAVHVENIGMNQFSVAHYYEQNGDLMRDPEMVFWKGPDMRYYPTYFRQDGTGYEEFSVEFEQGQPNRFSPRTQKAEAVFAGTWMKNIQHQQRL